VPVLDAAGEILQKLGPEALAGLQVIEVLARGTR
jgi:hypothetical protein